MPQAEVARKYQVDPSSVSRWARELRKSGASALKRKNAPGKVSLLTAAQWAEVTNALREGASVHGFNSDSWTGPRVQRFIVERFGVQFNSNYLIGRAHLLAGLAFRSRRLEPAARPQRPAVRSTHSAPAFSSGVDPRASSDVDP